MPLLLFKIDIKKKIKTYKIYRITK